MQWTRQWGTVLAVTAGALLATPVVATAQQQAGTITGRITDANTGQPVAAAQVTVVNTTLGAVGGEDGRFTLRAVPARAVEVRVIRVGYAEQKVAVTVPAGGQVTADFQLRPISLQLSAVVSTATGPQRRVELGNTTANINAADLVGKAPIANVNDMLTARAPGVVSLPNSMVGTASRVRIRGTTSLSLSNSPIYIIDGVRMTTNAGGNYQGGSVTSRVNDLNPDDIESIEVVKGPSAATLYGTDAANGVILITTKRGRSGKPQWNVWAEGGAITQRNEFPTAYTGWGKISGATSQSCFLSRQASGACALDSLTSFNLFEDDATTPFATGSRQNLGGSVAGGTEAVRYFVSAQRQNDVAALKMPEFNRAVYDSLGQRIRSEWNRPNAFERTSVRANLNTALTPKLDVAISSSYIQTDQRLPASDNNTYGLFSHAYGGPGYRQQTTGLGNVPLNGYRALTPGEMFRYTYNQNTNRFLGSASANWRPTTWWQNRANVGVDFASQADIDLCRRGECPGSTTRLEGFVDNDRTTIANYTVDLASQATWQARENVVAKTTVGAQYINYRTNASYVYGANLPPGATTPTAAATPTVSEATVLQKTLGLFVEEQVALNDRLFVTGALRTDQNSAFGSDFQRVVYPKASVSWLASDEAFFPKPEWLGEFRLRASYGAAGQQPGPNDALRYFVPSRVSVDRADVPGVTFDKLGNGSLKPERATEFEGGFDARMLNDRVNVEVTYYSKTTDDALIARVIAPSSGVGSGTTVASRTRFENLGAVKNAGLEGLVRAQLVDLAPFRWDVTINGSTNANKLVSLGGVPPQISTTFRQTEGYPLNGWWDRKFTYADADNNGIITASEITVDSAASFLGYSTPRHEVAVINGVDLFGRKLRLQAMVDWKGGYKIENVTEEFRCQSRNNCQALYDKSAPLAEQARVIALRDLGTRSSYAGFIEDGSFVRFRELSATYTPADAFVQKYLKARTGSITFAARNLGLWTDYTGVDPEMNYGTANIQNEFQTAPPPSTFTVRVNLGF